MQVVCPPAPMPKKSDHDDKMGMDPHDAMGMDAKGGDMKKGDMKKDIPAPPPCYTVQVSLVQPQGSTNPLRSNTRFEKDQSDEKYSTPE